MAKISFSKEALEGNLVPDGLYELRLEGFEPKFSKDKTSVNLNPVLKVVNNPNMSLNGKRIFDNMNSGASWIIEAFVHAMGLKLEPNAQGGGDLPGEFPDNGQDDPEKWPPYQGPLLGQVAEAMVKKTTYNGKENSKIDQWLCALGNDCNTKHPAGLAK